ncbi:MAG: hypothetical protein QNJ69_01400 [Gammaproteobacteria bacterium]|nr:hypothetical protein [Gammaproteobacteria bacterium]
MCSARIRDLDMGYTLDEFAKVLQGNFSAADSPYRVEQVAAGQWRVASQSDLAVTISVKQKPERQLGLLNLPVLAVSFAVTAGNDDEEQAFYDKFFKYFHKGGG